MSRQRHVGAKYNCIFIQHVKETDESELVTCKKTSFIQAKEAELSLCILCFLHLISFIGKLMTDETWSVADCKPTPDRLASHPRMLLYTCPPPYLSETMGGRPSIADEAETSIEHSST